MVYLNRIGDYMKRNGFTLIEILAVLIILGTLIAISIPAYQGIFLEAKRDNYNSKISEIEVAGNKYGELTKDDIKNQKCKDTPIEELIEKGYIVSEDEAFNVVYNPTDNKPMDGVVKICYCPKTYEIQSFYTLPFNQDSIYYKGEKVLFDDQIYLVTRNYTPGSIPNEKRGINATWEENKKTGTYFELANC